MLKSLTIHNGIKHHGVTFDFNQGMTTITGPNEAGKSLLIEFIRYGLFGVKALRGKGEDYPGLSVELEFSLKGKDYKVVRSLKGATIFHGDEAIAVGTSPVNQKVVELFGYGLDVFDAAHNVNQGQIESLGNMTASERKKMVDNVIGLSVLDDLIKWAGDEASILRREAEAKEETLVEPVEPTEPEYYEPSVTLQAKLTDERARKTERDQILGWLSNSMGQPVKPTTAIEETVEELEKLAEQRSLIQAEINQVKAAISAIPDAEYTVEALDKMTVQHVAHKEWKTYSDKVKALPPKPTLSSEQVQEEAAKIAAHQKWDRANAQYVKGVVECPACDHEFSTTGEDPGPEPERPQYTLTELEQQLKRIEAWDRAPAPVPETEAPDLTLQGIAVQRRALEKAAEKKALQERLLGLVLPPDVSDKLKERRGYEQALAVYEAKIVQYEAWLKEKVQKEQRLAELGDVEYTVGCLEAYLESARIYERGIEVYERDKARYDTVALEVAGLREQEAQLKAAREALKELKGKVKAYLVPSLNKVASKLLAEMTGGERTTIVVDEDFNITVDGQDLNLLSGSAKAVANLAIRIGLGQVLTNKVFSVFMGDELDAAMDSDRAGYTAETLRNLTSKISQVILVTHKKPQADHYIELVGN